MRSFNFTFYFFLVIFGFSQNSCSSVYKNISLTRYGVNGDGVTDDYLALQKALALPGKKIISFDKSKTYFISKTLRIFSNTEIIGNGAKIIIPNKEMTFRHFIANDASNIHLSGLSLHGNRAYWKGKKSDLLYTTGRMLEFKNCRNITLTNLNLSESVVSGLHLEDVSEVGINNCSFHDIGLETPLNKGGYWYDGIFINAKKSVDNILIDNCKFYNIGSLKKSAKRMQSEKSNDGDGIQMIVDKMTASNALRNIKIKDCVFENVDRRAVKIQSGVNITIENCKVKSSGSFVGLSLYKNASNVKIIKNVAENLDYSFAYVSGKNKIASNVLIEENTIETCGRFLSTSENSVFQNSTFSKNNVSDAIECTLLIECIDCEFYNNNISYSESGNGLPIRFYGGNNIIFSKNVVSTAYEGVTCLSIGGNVTNYTIEGNVFNSTKAIRPEYWVATGRDDGAVILKKNKSTIKPFAKKTAIKQ